MEGEEVRTEGEVEINPKCILYDKVLSFEEAFAKQAPECWVAFDPNVRALTMADPEFDAIVRESARCWNCLHFVLELKGIYSIARIFSQPPPEQPATEEKREEKPEEHSLYEELARGEG
jgi:hypothetical protein